MMRRSAILAPCLVATFLSAACVPVAPTGDTGLAFNLSGAASDIRLATAGEPQFSARVIVENLPGYVGHHAATITSLPDGGLLAAWYSYQGPHELEGSAIFMSRQFPGEDAWQPPQLHIDRPSEGDGNPVLYRDGDRLWLFQAVTPGRAWSAARIEFQTSDDAGASWSSPRVLSARLGANVKYPPLRLRDGTLLLPAYDDLVQQSLFFASADGERWTLRASVFTPPPAQNLQPSVVALADGRLLATMRGAGGWLWVTSSDDDGLTWTPPQDANFPNPGSAAALLRLASGNLLLIYNDSATERTRLTAALSADDGATWPVRRMIAAADEVASYPSAIQTPDGAVQVVYSRRREAIVHVTLNEAWIAAMPTATDPG